MVKAALLGAVAALASRADAFYLPGVAPHSFKRGESVELKVNKLTSSRTQVRVSVVYGSVVFTPLRSYILNIYFFSGGFSDGR